MASLILESMIEVEQLMFYGPNNPQIKKSIEDAFSLHRHIHCVIKWDLGQTFNKQVSDATGWLNAIVTRKIGNRQPNKSELGDILVNDLSDNTYQRRILQINNAKYSDLPQMMDDVDCFNHMIEIFTDVANDIVTTGTSNLFDYVSPYSTVKLSKRDKTKQLQRQTSLKKKGVNVTNRKIDE